VIITEEGFPALKLPICAPTEVAGAPAVQGGAPRARRRASIKGALHCAGAHGPASQIVAKGEVFRATRRLR
jgi:hypothetical protein